MWNSDAVAQWFNYAKDGLFHTLCQYFCDFQVLGKCMSFYSANSWSSIMEFYGISSFACFHPKCKTKTLAKMTIFILRLGIGCLDRWRFINAYTATCIFVLWGLFCNVAWVTWCFLQPQSWCYILLKGNCG